MLFGSSLFLMAFLPIALFFYYVCFRKVGIKTKNFILLFTSFVFLLITDWFLCCLLTVIAVINYIIGRHLFARQSKFTFAAIIIFNIIVIVAYYATGPILSWIFGNVHLFYTPLPLIGIVYLINICSFLLVCYRKSPSFKVGFFRNMLYMLFFPVMTVGPVLNYDTFMNQACQREYNTNSISKGIKRFTMGLGKVIILGQTLSYAAKTGFINAPNITMFFAFFAIICFILQVYYELSGLSDMAIGVATMFGFKMPENFSHPLICNSYSSFVTKFNTSILNFVTDAFARAPKKTAPFLIIFFESLLFSFFFGFSQNTPVIFAILFICLLFEQYVLKNFIFKNKIINMIIQTIFFYPILIIIFAFIGSPTFIGAIEYLKLLINPFAGIYNVTSGTMFIGEHLPILIVAVLGIFPFAPQIKQRLIKHKISVPIYLFCYLGVFAMCVLYFSSGNYLPFFASFV